jgi:hypothetical protein
MQIRKMLVKGSSGSEEQLFDKTKNMLVSLMVCFSAEIRLYKTLPDPANVSHGCDVFLPQDKISGWEQNPNLQPVLYSI